jgi:hypothetical protein
MPLMVTFFNVRRGRDTIFKRSMRHFFPQTMRRYESEYGIRFVGWFNVTEGSDWNNMVILVVVDEHDGADLDQALLVGVKEATQLLGRLVQEVPPLELCLLGELAKGLDSGRGHGLYTKSGPIRSRRKMMCFFSKIDSATRWPSPRAEGSA